MKPTLMKFWRAESGAVTVDWVVLSAALIGLGLLVLGPIAYNADSSSREMGTNIGERPVGYPTD